MTTDAMTRRRDFAASALTMALIWGPGVLVMGLTGPLGGLGRTLGWVAGLSWMAALCFWNYVRCRRLHCAFTGPFFLAMDAAAVLAGLGVLPFGRETWSVIGDAAAIGGIALCCLPELIWGRYVGAVRR